MEIDIINYFLGVLFILLGFLVDKNPNLIAGYNTMSKDEKENFDITGYKKLIKQTLVTGGLFCILANLICVLLSLNSIKIFISFLPTCFIASFLVWKSKEFHKNSSVKMKPTFFSRTFSIAVLIFTLAIPTIIIAFVIYGSSEPNISVSTQEVSISGLYGFHLPTKEIKAIEIVDSLPKILLRTNGFGLRKVKKGYFEMENEGRCKLFLQGKHSPFIKIIYSNNKLLYLNFEDERKTLQLYKDLLRIRNDVPSSSEALTIE